MPWAAFDDKFADHPKNAGLSDAAFRLHVTGILYCNRHLTDGLIDADEVPRLVRKYRTAALKELVDKEMWTHHELLNAYEVRDYLQWNRSRQTVLEERERKSAAGRKGAQSKWGNR